MLFLLLATVAAQTPVEAERAFAADAQALGQWTAFRKWAAADAVMFLPQPKNAQAAMKDWRDPAHAVAWSPAASFVACDGRAAVNTGPWRQPDGSVGFFSTVWSRQADGNWRWKVDGGEQLTTPRVAPPAPAIRRAACGGRPTPAPYTGYRTSGLGQAQGASADGTLAWSWHVADDRSRDFNAWLWTGRRWEAVVQDQIAAPNPRPATP